MKTDLATPPPQSGTGSRSLELKGVAVHFEGVKALDGVDLVLSQGDILGIIGPNGAGKTTLVNVMSGYQRPTQGVVMLDDRDVTKLPSHRLSRMGIVRTFQNVRVFAHLSVVENVELGALGTGMSPSDARSTARELLALLNLTHLPDTAAGALPYGMGRRLGLARAAAARPRFLLLDEPAAGLDEQETRQLGETLKSLSDYLGCGTLLIEHDMGLVMRLCRRVQVLDYGKTIALGTPSEVGANPAVLAAYLGPHYRSQPDADH